SGGATRGLCNVHRDSPSDLTCNARYHAMQVSGQEVASQSSGVNLNRGRLWARGLLGDFDGQQAVAEPGLDAVAIGVGRHREGAFELAEHPLAEAEGAAGVITRLSLVAAKDQHVAIDLQLDVILAQARKF